MLCRANLLEGGVDEALQCQLQIVYVDIELQEVPIKLGLVEVQKIIWLALDVIHNVVEVLDHLIQAIQMGVLGQGRELMNRAKHRDQLLAPLGEKIKLVKDLGFIKVKRTCSWLTLQTNELPLTTSNKTTCAALITHHWLAVHRARFAV